jgi:hypothetical protein
MIDVVVDKIAVDVTVGTKDDFVGITRDVEFTKPPDGEEVADETGTATSVMVDTAELTLTEAVALLISFEKLPAEKGKYRETVLTPLLLETDELPRVKIGPGVLAAFSA